MWLIVSFFIISLFVSGNSDPHVLVEQPSPEAFELDDTFSSLQTFKNVRLRNTSRQFVDRRNTSVQLGDKEHFHPYGFTPIMIDRTPLIGPPTRRHNTSSNGRVVVAEKQVVQVKVPLAQEARKPTSIMTRIADSITSSLAGTNIWGKADRLRPHGASQGVAEDVKPVGIPWSEAYQVPQEAGQSAAERLFRVIAARFVESSTMAIDFTKGTFLLMCAGVVVGTILGLFLARCFSDRCPGGCGYCKNASHGSHCCEACHITTGKLHGIGCRSYHMTWKGNRVHRAVEDVRKIIVKQAEHMQTTLNHEGEASTIGLMTTRLDDKLKWSSKAPEFKWSVKVFIESFLDELRLELGKSVGDRADLILSLSMRAVFSYDTTDYMQRVDQIQTEERRKAREANVDAVREASLAAGRHPPVMAGKTVLN